jgi:hypothetical protein
MTSPIALSCRMACCVGYQYGDQSFDLAFEEALNFRGIPKKSVEFSLALAKTTR